MTITAAQIRAARGLLEWSRVRLALRANVRMHLVSLAERESRTLPVRGLDEIQRTLEAAGIEFTKGDPGVKLNAP